MMLGKEVYQRARCFVESQGRALEAARLRCHFDGAPSEEVLAELARFQNPDGGFGHALEADLRIAESSALATSIAFQILREIGSPLAQDARGRPLAENSRGKPLGENSRGRRGADDMVAAAIGYLLRTLDEAHLTWRIVPPSTHSVPQAPWWNQEAMEGARPPGEEPQGGPFVLNPTAELLGYLYDYRDQVPPSVLASLSQKVLAVVEAAEEMVMHDLLSCKRLAETAGLDATFRGRLAGALVGLMDKVVAREPSAWARYTLRPVQVAEGPQSPFYGVLCDVVPANLDYEVATQQEDGSWIPHWTWDDLYPEIWQRARVEWAGVLTAEKLLILQRYGRIAR